MSALLRLLATFALALSLLACSDDPAPSESIEEALQSSAIEHAEKHQDPKYVCPMHSQIVRDEEGTCPICGMDLVAKQVESGDANDGPPIVRIRPETVQNMGVRTEIVEMGRIWKRIDALGRVTYDEDAQSHVHPRAEGWVEKLLVRSEGDPVKRGDVLLELYSPELVNAQEEFLLALKSVQSGVLKGRGKDLLASARQRLRLFDVPESVIRKIEKTGKVRNRVPILAPRDGVVTSMGLKEGMFVTPASEMFTIANVDRIWVLVDVFEHQISWFDVGTSAEISVAALPGRNWEGKVDYIYPELDKMTRTLRVRLRFDNKDGKLKPNMLANAIIWGGAKNDVLSVNRDAIIETGKRRVVILALGEGRFQPTSVRTGIRSGGRVEIRSGLQPGAEVVVSGQFLIDSESNLLASFRRMGQ